MDRVFLDANILFSAAYKPSSRLIQLWELPEVELWSSAYAIKEAEVNLRRLKPEALEVLADRLKQLKQVASTNLRPLPSSVSLVEKDAPILQTAITAEATHLLTGDVKHSRYLYGSTVEGVQILLPAGI